MTDSAVSDRQSATGEMSCIVTSDPTDLEVYLSHRAALIDYAAPIVGCRARAEDLVQEAFIRFSSRRRRGDTAAGANSARRQPIAHPVSYLYRIVRNLALDWLRRPEASVETRDPATLVQMSAPTATPEQTVLHRDQLRALAEALAELPERTRIAFNMHRLEGRSLEQIAGHLGVSVVRAHQLVKDAIRHGAARLDAQDD